MNEREGISIEAIGSSGRAPELLFRPDYMPPLDPIARFVGRVVGAGDRDERQRTDRDTAAARKSAKQSAAGGTITAVMYLASTGEIVGVTLNGTINE